MKTPVELPAGYSTPGSLVVGWLLLTFSTFPILLGLRDLQIHWTGLIAGFVGIIGSLVLIFIGTTQKKRLLERMASQTASPGEPGEVVKN